MSKIKVAFECDSDLYERFRRIYPGHGQVAHFFRRVTKRVVNHVEKHGMEGLGKESCSIACDLADEDIDRGRI